MEWVVFEICNHAIFMEREKREDFLNLCMANELTDFGVVIKTFENRHEAISYCDKLNFVNNLIENL